MICAKGYVISFKNSILAQCLEIFLFNAAENEVLLNAKKELLWQIDKFPIVIEANGFFRIDRRHIAAVRNRV